jgi:hypothetical protein
MADAAVREARVPAPRGRRGGRAIDDAELRGKFDACTRGLLSPDDRDELHGLIEGIGDADPRRVGALLRKVAM